MLLGNSYHFYTFKIQGIQIIRKLRFNNQKEYDFLLKRNREMLNLITVLRKQDTHLLHVSNILFCGDLIPARASYRKELRPIRACSPEARHP